MRVIAGEKRHLLLKTLSSLSIRPTTDKIKETLFNMIQFDIKGRYFLDLFAGSGAIGIEALSRGASFCTFVDNNREAVKVIKENVEHTKLTKECEILQKDVLVALDSINGKRKTYGIVFLDPPYEEIDLYKMSLEKIVGANFVDNDTIVIVEAKKDFDNNICIDLGFDIYKEKIYKSNKHLLMRIKK